MRRTVSDVRGRTRGTVIGLAMSQLGVYILLASFIFVGAAHAAWVHFEQPSDRDTVAFQHYVDRYIGRWRSGDRPGIPPRDRRWAIAHPGDVLREGDQACDWLSKRAAAPDTDPEGRYETSRLISIYIGDPSVVSIAPIDPMSRRTVTAGAWRYLCRDVRNDQTVERPED